MFQDPSFGKIKITYVVNRILIIDPTQVSVLVGVRQRYSDVLLVGVNFRGLLTHRALGKLMVFLQFMPIWL